MVSTFLGDHLPVTSGSSVDSCQVLGGKSYRLHPHSSSEVLFSYQNTRRHSPIPRRPDLYTDRRNNRKLHGKLWCYDVECGRIDMELDVAYFSIVFNICL
jgi:hypothetical protein